MKKTIIFLFAAFTSLQFVSAEKIQQDSIKSVIASDVVVSTSDKETLSPKEQPISVSIISPYKINQRKIENVKDLSIVVPNVYIPDYGSRLTMPVYIRGIGARSGNQSIAFYVDNVAYMDKSTFDFDFQDIQRVEVLRGPQGTLYGRNAMGGILNIYTLSPLQWQGTKAKIGAGNYGQYEAAISTYQKISDRFGISVSANANSCNGFFYNATRDEQADKGWNAAGRLKAELLISDKWKMTVTGSYNQTDQNAFAYGSYDTETGKIGDPVFNDEGSYKRRMSNNSLRFEYRSDKILLTSNTGYQWLDDNMNMDQDFTKKSTFSMNQTQLENSINEEFTIRSIDNNSNYNWSSGLFTFYTGMKTTSLVTFKEDGIKDILQPIFDNMLPKPSPLRLTITDENIPNPGQYFTPSFGFAVYHQSSFKNLFTDGLTLTVGVRLDYEKQFLEYETSMAMNIQASGRMFPEPVSMAVEKDLQGSEDQSFIRFQPKFALQYEINPDFMTYLNISNGYKAGGYNIQMFSEVIQDSMKSYRPMGMGSTTDEEKRDLKNTISYKPENTWNFELGTKFSLLDGKLSSEVALFYMDIKDIQLTQFVDGGSGRILTNAGRARSFGAEVSLNAKVARNLGLDLAYGYTNSKFTEYDTNDPSLEYDPELNYKGKYVPYAPAHTLSIGAAYTFHLKDKWLQAIVLSSQLNGAGRIYWTEKNDISQPFYCLLNAEATFRAKWIQFTLWGKNLTNTEYGAFYFESFKKSYIQRGRPLTFGATVGFTF